MAKLTGCQVFTYVLVTILISAKAAAQWMAYFEVGNGPEGNTSAVVENSWLDYFYRAAGCYTVGKFYSWTSFIDFIFGGVLPALLAFVLLVQIILQTKALRGFLNMFCFTLTFWHILSVILFLIFSCCVTHSWGFGWALFVVIFHFVWVVIYSLAGAVGSMEGDKKDGGDTTVVVVQQPAVYHRV